VTLQRLVVEDFQSIEKADIELGGLTVIVGPSSSGKSAFIRAARALFRNINSPSVVRHGAGTTRVTAHFDDGTVSLERGKGASTYRLTKKDGGEDAYPKSGVAVPDDIAKFLCAPIIEAQDLLFTTQFDRPFLLAESGSTTARVIGDLTNANLLHEATREANRRRLERSGKLKVRKADVQTGLDRLKGLGASSLQVKKEALAEVRGSIDEVREQARQVKDLLEAATNVEVVVSAIAEADRQDFPDLSAEIAEAEGLLTAATELRWVAQDLELAADEALLQSDEAVRLGEEAEAKQKEFDEMLHKAGQCPICGSAT